LHWVNTLLGNLKRSVAGTYHAFDHAKCARRYLAEFAYRFNRRFDLAGMLPRLLRALVSTGPLPVRMLRCSEVCAQSGFSSQNHTTKRFSAMNFDNPTPP